MKAQILLAALLGIAVVHAQGPSASAAGAASRSADRGVAASAPTGGGAAATGQGSLSFEPNEGQAPGDVEFLARGRGFTLFVTGREAVVRLHPRLDVTSTAGFARGDGPGSSAEPPANGATLRMRLAGAAAACDPVGIGELAAKSHYLTGNDPERWVTDVPHFASVRCSDVYEGVDLEYHARQGALEYDIIVWPAARPDQIELAFDGAEALDLDDAGHLVLRMAGGALVQHAPVVYQEIDGERRTVSGRYVMRDEGRVGFAIGSYDPDRALVIDPVLGYSSYLGGSGNEEFRAVALDAAGNIVAAGFTTSPDYPPTGALDGTSEVVVSKLDPTGSTLIFSTFLGGSSHDLAHGVAVDPAGVIHVVGETGSADFPMSAGALDTTYDGANDGFLFRLSPDGSSLLYSTFLGKFTGSGGTDRATAVTADASGATFVVGATTNDGYPTTLNAFMPVYPDVGAAQPWIATFLSEIDAAGQLVYSTYLGGPEGAFATTRATAVALGPDGTVYVAGATSEAGFPATSGVVQPQLAGDVDAFVARFDLEQSGVSSLVFATFLGGGAYPSGSDVAYSVTVDGSGNAIVTGETFSGDFPTTAGSFQPDPTSAQYGEVFVAKLDPSGSTRLFSTYVGASNGSEFGRGVALDAAGNIFVAGYSGTAEFPMANAMFPFNSSELLYQRPRYDDAIVFGLDSTGSSLLFSTYLGGCKRDQALALAIDGADRLVVAGLTQSDDFPTTAGAFQPAYAAGYEDAFVTRIDPVGASADLEVTLAAAPNPVLVGDDLVYTTTVVNHGPDPASHVSVRHLLAPELAFVSATPSQGSCSAACGGIVCDLGTLADAAMATVTLTLNVTAKVYLRGEALVMSHTGDPNVGGPYAWSAYNARQGNNYARTFTTVEEPPSNQPPAAFDDAATTPEDTPVSIAVLANDQDPDGDALSVLSATSGAHGTVGIDAGGTGVTYAPDPDFHGTDAFTYVVDDGSGETDSAAVTVVVTPVNDPPEAADDTAGAVHGTPAVIHVLANDSDVDGDALSVAAVTSPAGGTVVVNADGTLTYTADVFAGLAAEIAALPGLNKGQLNSLLAKVDAASRSFARGNRTAGLNQLGALVNELEAMKRSGRLDAALADALIARILGLQSDGLVDAFGYTVSDGQGGTDTAVVTVTITLS